MHGKENGHGCDKGKKDRYKAAAAAAGYSLNEFMEKAMDALAAEILGQ